MVNSYYLWYAYIHANIQQRYTHIKKVSLWMTSNFTKLRLTYLRQLPPMERHFVSIIPWKCVLVRVNKGSRHHYWPCIPEKHEKYEWKCGLVQNVKINQKFTFKTSTISANSLCWLIFCRKMAALAFNSLEIMVKLWVISKFDLERAPAVKTF